MANLRPNYGTLESNANWGPVPLRTGGPEGATTNVVDHRGTTEETSEPTCVHGYVPRRWKDGSEEDFDEGQLLFVTRSTPDITDYRMLSFLNLGQMNNKLHDLGIKSKELFTSDPKTLPVDMDIETIGKLRNLPDIYWATHENEENLVGPVSSKPGGASIRFMSPEIVRSIFNVLGPIQNLMGGTNDITFEPKSRKRNLDINVLNVIVKDISESFVNYWGIDVKVGSKLWLIYKRVKDSETRKYTQYAYVPHSTYERDTPSLRARVYRDHTGTRQYGICYYIGMVMDNEYNTLTTNEVAQKASGIIGTSKDQRDFQVVAKPLKVDFNPLPARQRNFLY